MQNLARGGMSAKAVEDLIRATNVTPTSGVDLIQDGRVQDISDIVESVDVEYNRDADIRRLLRMTLNDSLDWDQARVRPWQQIGTARFYQGVYGLQRPRIVSASKKLDIQGYGIGSLLNQPVDDTIEADQGDNSIELVKAFIARAAVVGLDVRIDPTSAEATLPVDMTWALNVSSADTFAMLIDDVFATIPYRPHWVDPEGRLRSAPMIPMIDRPAEWTFDVSDIHRGTVEGGWTSTLDQVDDTNWWGFVYSELGTAPEPGAGMVVIDRSNGGRKVRKWVTSSVTDQAALEAQAQDQVDKELAARRQIVFTTGPMPQLDHEDIIDWVDPYLGVQKAVITRFVAGLKTKSVQITAEVIQDGDEES